MNINDKTIGLEDTFGTQARTLWDPEALMFSADKFLSNVTHYIVVIDLNIRSADYIHDYQQKDCGVQ